MKKIRILTYSYYCLITFCNNWILTHFEFTNLQIFFLSFFFTLITLIPILIWNCQEISASLFKPSILISLNLLIFVWIFNRSYAEISNGFLYFLYDLFSVAFTEELIFRGIFYSSLLKQYSPIISTILTTLLFVAMHFPRIWLQNEAWITTLPNICFASLLICLFFYLSHNILLAAIIHFFLNYFESANPLTLILLFDMIYLLLSKLWNAKRKSI
ncbi:CPBP family intramembrane glutamic endopeptidase [Dubosiella newyorkensis]|uniref:CPBP family intramembrane glutamic endopeptidase n=1 Tax=Dubosiella newyorkensis TaxID=1862672 RepID=UPI0034E52561